MIKGCKSVHITFPFLYINKALRCYNRIKKKQCKHTTLVGSYFKEIHEKT